MAGVSFDKRRAPRPPEVRVRVSGTGASVDGTAVVAAPGEPIQQAVLNHLQRLAISLGVPVHAVIHDDRSGCVIPLEVTPDGASRTRGEPARVPAQQERPAPVPLIPEPTPDDIPDPEPDSLPPSRFDAMAEEVLADEPVAETAEGAALLTDALTRIGEAVREGRSAEAATLADHAIAQGAALLGPRHPEVLHLGELSAYIAYLSGDTRRACALSLDLAGRRRESGDAEAAYGNIRSADSAWRAVPDPAEGLRLGHALIALWTLLTTEPGPASTDPHPLHSARARMTRLRKRAEGA